MFLHNHICFSIFLVDDIHDVDAELGQEEDAIAFAEFGAAVRTFVLLEPGVADSNTGLSLHAPVAGQDPGVAVLAAEGKEVALQTTVLDGIIETKGYLGIAYVEVAVDEVALDITLVEEGIAQPATHVGGDEQVTPFLVGILVDIPGIHTDRGSHRPEGVYADVGREVGRQRNIVEEVVAQGYSLCIDLAYNGKAKQAGQYGYNSSHIHLRNNNLGLKVMQIYKNLNKPTNF